MTTTPTDPQDTGQAPEPLTEPASDAVAETVVAEPVAEVVADTVADDGEANLPQATEAEIVVAEPEAAEAEVEVEAEVVVEPEVVAEVEVEPEVEVAVEAEPEPAPAPAPAVPKPSALPKPGPRPGPPRPGPAAVAAPATAAPAAAPAAPAPAPPIDPAEEADAAAFGSVAADGTVTVRDGDAERVVGQVPDVPEAEALSLYVRRYLDLKAQVVLLEARLPHLSAKEATSSLESLTEHLTEPAAVGDLPALRERLAVLGEQAQELRAKAAAEREAARAVAIAERTVIVEKVEAIAQTPTDKVQWRDASAAIAELLTEWKTAQRSGVRIDRPTEDALWKRFSHARTVFDKARRAHFTALDKRNAEAKSVKEELVARADALATSTDWGPTAGAFRDLMDSWRSAPRGSRKEDDALWARFKAAQDAFFAARNQVNEALDTEYQANLEVKEALLVKAEALLPITDLAATKRTLREIQDAWDEAGKVPRNAMSAVEGRLRAVEQAVRDADKEEMRRSDPELKARADGMTAQLLDSITALEAEIAQAKAAGNAKAAAKAEAELSTKKQWLDAVRGARG